MKEILGIQFLRKFDKLFSLKVNSNYELYIEVLNLKDSNVETIEFDCNLYFKNYYNHLNKNFSEVEIVDIFTFFVSEKLDYFFLRVRANEPFQTNKTWNIKISFDGRILLKDEFLETTYLPTFLIINKYIVDENFTFFDTETFEIISLTDYFDDFLEDDGFSYIRHTENRYSIFSSLNNSFLGLIFFDKDGDMPRGTHCVFKVDEYLNSDLIFKYKIDEWGSNHVFSENGDKIAYFYGGDFGKVEIKNREIDVKHYQNEETFEINYSKESPFPQELFLSNDNYIILVFYDRFEIFSRELKIQTRIFWRDIGSPYQFSNGKLFFVQHSKLRIELF